MILIVDFGSQTAHLIGRRLKEYGAEVSYSNPEHVLEKIKEFNPKGIVLSGSPFSVYENGAPTVDSALFHLNLPILGICYGWQLMAKLLGGKVVSGKKEYGPEEIMFSQNIFNLPKSQCKVIMSHGDMVETLPKDFESIASTRSIKFAVAVNKSHHFFGVQFHPEVDDTEHGSDILKYFIHDVVGCDKKSHQIDIEKMIENIRSTVGKREVICAVSGGVDSTVAAYLIQKAIGSQLHTVYVENGLMREGTKERVCSLFKDVTVVHAEKLFLDQLKGIIDPEEKRKIIGKLYIDLFHEELLKYPAVHFLAQGTIYSDVIESKGTKHASKIKSHHNVGGLPEDLKFELLEPLRHFYKDEVREIGKRIGIQESILQEHPFPGPGYAVRIRGEVNEKRLHQVKLADHIVVDELKKTGLYDNLFQCFAVMTGAYSTSVKGDEGVLAEVVALRAYESKDIMTSTWARLPYDVLQAISSRIVNEVPHVSRVVYDISTKPPATMEWE